MKIFVGNLSFNTSDNDLRDAFAPYGEIASAQVITDRRPCDRVGSVSSRWPLTTRRSRPSAALNGSDLQGRALNVNEAKPREDRGSRSGGGSWGR